MTTKAQRDILYHSLGMIRRNYRRSQSWWLDCNNYRNHFCATVERGEHQFDLDALVSLGFMRRSITINDGQDCYYHATKSGILHAKENFARDHQPPG